MGGRLWPTKIQPVQNHAVPPTASGPQKRPTPPTTTPQVASSLFAPLKLLPELPPSPSRRNHGRNPHRPRYLVVRPLNRCPKTTSRFRVSAEIQETPSSSSPSISVGPVKEPLPISPPPGFNPPKPKRFLIRPDKFLDILGASLALLFRLGTGAFVLGYSVSLVSGDKIPSSEYAVGIAGFKLKETARLGPRPEKPIEIYEFESCPYCRKVREIVSVLDLDVLFYPCPKQGPNFRPKVLQMGGKQQFPYMDDITNE